MTAHLIGRYFIKRPVIRQYPINQCFVNQYFIKSYLAGDDCDDKAAAYEALANAH